MGRVNGTTFSAYLVLVFLVMFGKGAEPAEVINLSLEKQANRQQGEGGNSVFRLEDALRLALEHHPRLKGAQQRVGAQGAVVRQELAAYYPTIEFNNFYRTGTASGSTSNTRRGFDFLSSQAEFGFTLYDFGKRQGSVQSARDTLDATRFAFRVTLDEVVLGVKEAYYGYLQSRALLKVREETVKDRELLVRQAQAFYEVGTRSKIDVARAEANLFSARADLIGAQNGVKVAWAALKNAIGLREFPEQPLEDEVAVRREPMSLDDAKSAAYSSRPELLQLEAERKAEDQKIAVARRGHLPDISLRSSYGGRTEQRLRDAYPLTDTWQVQINLEVPIFNGFRTTNEVQEALHNYYTVKAEEEEAKQRIALEVEESYLGVLEAEERIKATEAALKAAKENLDLANGRYQVGVGSIIEVTEAQTLHTDAQTSHIQSIYDYKIAEARLLKAVGRR